MKGMHDRVRVQGPRRSLKLKASVLNIESPSTAKGRSRNVSGHLSSCSRLVRPRERKVLSQESWSGSMLNPMTKSGLGLGAAGGIIVCAESRGTV